MTRFEKINNMDVSQLAHYLAVISGRNIDVMGYCENGCQYNVECRRQEHCVNWDSDDDMIWWLEQEVDDCEEES